MRRHSLVRHIPSTVIIFCILLKRGPARYNNDFTLHENRDRCNFLCIAKTNNQTVYAMSLLRNSVVALVCTTQVSSDKLTRGTSDKSHHFSCFKYVLGQTYRLISNCKYCVEPISIISNYVMVHAHHVTPPGGEDMLDSTYISL